MQSAYKTEQLIEQGVDFSNIYAEKQDVVKEMTGFDFDLSRIVQFLQKETKQFTQQLPLALDIDRSIYSIYLKWKESKGEEAEAKPQPKREEPKAEPKKETSPQVAEWKEAAETLKDFIDMGSTEENIAEWTEALETINMFLETEEPKMAKGGGINNFEISKIKQIVEKKLDINRYKIQREDSNALILFNKNKDMSINIRLDLIPQKIWFGGFAKLEKSSISLADPKLNYQNTSARKVTYKKINIRKEVNSYSNFEKLLNNFLGKTEELDKMAKGGGVENENAYMVANNNKQIFHHTKEMANALKNKKNVPAWVVAKVNRSATDLSDATHYLEGEEGKYAQGGGVKKVGKVMHEFKEGTLHSGKSGKIVKDPRQAIAIALSEAGLSKK